MYRIKVYAVCFACSQQYEHAVVGCSSVPRLGSGYNESALS